MKKIYLSVIILCLLTMVFVPALTLAADEGIVTCGNDASNPCEINDFFDMLLKIYNFIVKMIATPLAVIALSVGGIMMMISAGNPELMGKGKNIIYAAIIGLVLVWCSWLIINFILDTIGATPLG